MTVLGGTMIKALRTMKLPASEAHIGKFDAEQCEQLIQLVRKHFP